jgi:hypothetical protein
MATPIIRGSAETAKSGAVAKPIGIITSADDVLEINLLPVPEKFTPTPHAGQRSYSHASFAGGIIAPIKIEVLQSMPRPNWRDFPPEGSARSSRSAVATNATQPQHFRSRASSAPRSALA